MKQDELGALTRLGFGEIGRLVGGVAGMHRAIAERAFGSSGPGGSPARVLHDGISSAVYAGLRGGAELAGRGAGLAVEALPAAGPPPSASPRGALLMGVVSGLIGDALEAQQSPLAPAMSVRHAGRPVEPSPEALAATFPAARPRLVVFLHGLMETEFAWERAAAETGGTYAARLTKDARCSALLIRYNSGRRISENGAALSGLLEEILESWPVEVEDIALVGHSMGGLVARSACHQGDEAGLAWVGRVRQVVSLGTPHMGAPLAGAVHLAAAALDVMPESRSAAGFLRRRSAGIRDLRAGSLVDEDWRDRDPDALRGRACREVPLLDGATHHFVSATITRSSGHPLGRLLGDWLVLEPSACGRGRTRRLAFRAEDGLHVGGAHHLALLNHPVVYEKLRDWLST